MHKTSKKDTKYKKESKQKNIKYRKNRLEGDTKNNERKNK